METIIDEKTEMEIAKKAKRKEQLRLADVKRRNKRKTDPVMREKRSEQIKKYEKAHPLDNKIRGIIKDCTRKDRKEKNNKSWDLDKEYAKFLFQQDCLYCGCKVPGTTRKLLHSLDRIDNDIRVYQANNVAPCCVRCNDSKGDRTLENFLQICTNITLCQQGRSEYTIHTGEQVLINFHSYVFLMHSLIGTTQFQ